MGELFQGTYVNRIDAKGRVSIPAPYRRVLEENDPEWHEGLNPRLTVLFNWPGKNCLEVYSIAAMNDILEKVKKLPARSERRTVAARLLASNSQRFQLDDNGRLLLPKNLMDMAKISEEATFAGMIDSFEMWNSERYEQELQGAYEWYDENGDPNDPLADLE